MISTAERTKLTTKLLGYVWVDTAKLIIGDPVHILPYQKPHPSYPEPLYCENLKVGYYGQLLRLNERVPVDVRDGDLVYERMEIEAAVVCSTGSSDGRYPVYGLVDDRGETHYVVVSFADAVMLQPDEPEAA
jgi:hypothetical protein